MENLILRDDLLRTGCFHSRGKTGTVDFPVINPANQTQVSHKRIHLHCIAAEEDERSRLLRHLRETDGQFIHAARIVIRFPHRKTDTRKVSVLRD